MRYLKIYESFGKEERNKILKEICLELEDYGYTINIIYKQNVDYRNFQKKIINISCIIIEKFVGNVHQQIRFSDVKEYLLRMKDYLGDNYINCVCSFFELGCETIILNEDTEIGENEKLFKTSINYINDSNYKRYK